MHSYYKDDELGFLERTGIPRWTVLVGLGLLFLLCSFILFTTFTTRVQAGQGCLLVRYGEVDGQMGPGLHYYNPFTMDQKCYSTLRKTYELVSGNPRDSDSEADYVDWAIDSRTAEGIQVWTMLSVQYHIPVENVGFIYQNVARTDERVQEQIIKYHVRTIVPQLINTYEADALFFGDLPTISADIRVVLSEKLLASGIILDSFELKRGDFEDAYENSIREQGLINQNIERELLNQEYAAEQAETNRIAAEGQAEQTRIAAQATADQAIIAQNATNQNTLSAAETNATAARLNADAEVYALNMTGQAYTDNPSLLQREQYQIIAGANVIYLPSDVLGFIDLTMVPQNQPPPSQEILQPRR